MPSPRTLLDLLKLFFHVWRERKNSRYSTPLDKDEKQRPRRVPIVECDAVSRQRFELICVVCGDRKSRYRSEQCWNTYAYCDVSYESNLDEAPDVYR